MFLNAFFRWNGNQSLFCNWVCIEIGNMQELVFTYFLFRTYFQWLWLVLQSSFSCVFQKKKKKETKKDSVSLSQNQFDFSWSLFSFHVWKSFQVFVVFWLFRQCIFIIFEKWLKKYEPETDHFHYTSVFGKW